jgi:hypothetical protein
MKLAEALTISVPEVHSDDRAQGKQQCRLEGWQG